MIRTAVPPVGLLRRCPPGSGALTLFLMTDCMLFVMQVRYKDEYEKNRGKAYTQVADDPEMLRVKRTQMQVSDVSVCSSVTPFPSLLFLLTSP